MQRAATSNAAVAVGLVVGLVIGLGAMYVIAPSILRSSTVTVTTSSTLSSLTISTPATTSSGSPGTVTVTASGSPTETVTTTAVVTSVSTVTAGQSTTGVAYVSIPKGTGDNLSLNFTPAVIKVVIGVNNTVLWANNDVTKHTVTADILKMFNQVLTPGQTFAYTFTQPGTYGYTCQYHGYMIGKVIVKA